MSEADEMFYKLGYILIEETENMIVYELKTSCVHRKEIRIVNNCSVYVHAIFWEGHTEYSLCIDIKELQAIMKKIEEQNWYY